MRVLFDSNHSFPPQRVGGLESSVHALARGLKQRGHDVAVAAALVPTGMLGLRHRLVRRLTGRPSKDRMMGYPLYRTWEPQKMLDAIIREFAPDVIVVEGDHVPGRGFEHLEAGRRVVMSLRNCQWDGMGHTPEPHPDARYIANSIATAAAYRERFGIEPAIVRPSVEPDEYRCEVDPRYVTFVNPVQKKGLEVAIGVAAACPEIPFHFVYGWPLSQDDRNALKARLAALPNVTLSGPHSDMRDVYRTAAFMLVPSQWFEAWGRVVTEAQVSGIPAVATNFGGLGEAVGAGGILVDLDAPMDDWIAACRKLWSDTDLRQQLSAAARAEAQAPVRRPEAILDELERVLNELC